MNNILQTERPIPLEFLINGQFLRTTIDEFLTTNGISSETLLSVEYVRAVIPPLHVASYEHDAWVSSVDVLSNSSRASQRDTITSGQESILSGSYDGILRVWDMSNNVRATSNEGGHDLAVKAVKFMSHKKIASGAMDRSIRVWNYNEEAGSLTTGLELFGHKSSVDSLDVHIPSQRLLSASTDWTVGYWSTNKSEAPEAPSGLTPSNPSKRRKISQPSKTAPQRGPLAILSGHKNPVSAAIHAPHDHTVAYSASWDHAIRTWDLTTSQSVDVRTTAHPLLSLTALQEVHLLAAGTSARHITLTDPRASATTISAMTLRGHTNGVVSLDIDPDSPYRLVSGSHDGTCRVWDVRSVRPGVSEMGSGQVGESVYVIQRESKAKMPPGGDGVKVFDVRWDKDVGIVSAGEDKRVQVNKQENLER